MKYIYINSDWADIVGQASRMRVTARGNNNGNIEPGNEVVVWAFRDSGLLTKFCIFLEINKNNTLFIDHRLHFFIYKGFENFEELAGHCCGRQANENRRSDRLKGEKNEPNCEFLLIFTHFHFIKLGSSFQAGFM